jgi:hypothetical protein
LALRSDLPALRRLWQCTQNGARSLPKLYACGGKFKVTHGTPLEGTHLPTRLWFTALYLVAASCKGISSVKLSEHLGVGQKTAWFLGQRIRRMMEDKDGLLTGIVGVGETYLGVKGKIGKRDRDTDQPTGRSRPKKAIITVATVPGGHARAAGGKTQSGKPTAKFVFDRVSREGAWPTSDELLVYRLIGREYTAYFRVNRSKGDYAYKDAHTALTARTNTVESFNTTLKQAWVGMFYWFSLKHTDRFLKEANFCWICRKMPAEHRVLHLFGGSAGRMRWKELIT